MSILVAALLFGVLAPPAQAFGYGGIAGTVKNASAVGLGDIFVTAYLSNGSGGWDWVAGRYTAADGAYDFSESLEPGTYRIAFEDPSGAYITQYYDNKTTLDLATDVAVTDGATTPGINATLAPASAPALSITSFSPGAGPVGTVVTLTGTNFTGATAVAFHGTAAVTHAVVSATQITATVPAGATTGTIAVTNPAGTGVSAASFTVTVPAGAPTLTSFTPTSGPVGTVVTLTGTNFTGATAVAFHGTAAVTHAVTSATQITTTVPAAATTGTIAVTTPAGIGTSLTSFTVVFRPKVTLKLSGLTSGAMRLGRRVTAKGKVTPTRLAGSKVKLTVQKKRGARWIKVKSVARTISATGAYSWKYKPATRGAYRMRATIAKSALHTAAKTKWRPFRVK